MAELNSLAVGHGSTRRRLAWASASLAVLTMAVAALWLHVENRGLQARLAGVGAETHAASSAAGATPSSAPAAHWPVFQALSAGADAERLAHALFSASHSNSVTMRALRIGQGSLAPGRVGQVAVDVELEGSYPAVKRVLGAALLDNTPVVIDRLSIRRMADMGLVSATVSFALPRLEASAPAAR